MRGVVLAIVAVALACGAVTLYVLATRPAPAASVETRDVAITARVASGDAPPTTLDASSRAERESALQALRRSGRADEDWNARAGAVFDAIKPSAAVEAVGCYVVGRAATLTFSSEMTYREALARVQALAPYRA